MPNWLIRILGFVYEKIPKNVRPYVKTIFVKTTLRLEALVSGKKVLRGDRIAFVDHEVADLEPYELLGPGKSQVTVRAVATTVSPGTEAAVLCGLPGARRAFPYYPGYSFAGEIATVGSKVSSFQPGDRVAGKLPHTNLATVDADQLFSVPDSVDMCSASFIELGIIVLQGVRKAGIKPGDRVAVLGQGIIGQMCNRVAKMQGAIEVIAVATSDSRERFALRANGADRFVVIGRDSQEIPQIDADIVLEAVGLPGAIGTSMRLARPGGTVALVGSARGAVHNFDTAALIQERNLTVIGAHISAMPDSDRSNARWTYRQEGRLFLDLLESGMLSVKELVSWDALPSEANAVYEKLALGGSGHVGISFHWQDN